MHGGWFFGMGWFWLLILFVIVGAVWLFASTAVRGRQGPSQGARKRPEEILRDRLARGEIDETEYRKRLDALREA